MIAWLLELKDTLVDMVDMANPNVYLSEAQWDEAKNLELLLLLPFQLTKKLQYTDLDQLTPGLFYKEWKKLYFRLSKIGGMLVDTIKSSMECRGKNLGNDVLLAAIYVDPMHRVVLSDSQLERGKRQQWISLYI